MPVSTDFKEEELKAKMEELLRHFNTLEQKVETLMSFMTETPNDYAAGTVLGVTTEGKASALSASALFSNLESEIQTWADAIYAPIDSPVFTTEMTSEGPVTFEDDLEVQGDSTLTGLKIYDTSKDHMYIFAVNELTANRTITLPLLTGNDEIVFAAHTKTLTNKRVTKRTYTTTSTSALTPEKDNYDYFELTAQADNLAINNHSTSTPVAGDAIVISVTCSTADKNISFGTNYSEAAGIDLPSTLTASKTIVLGFLWNAGLSKYILVYLGEEE